MDKYTLVKEKPRHVDKYVLECEFMYGDADFYDTQEFVVGSRGDDIDFVFEFFDAYKKLRWNEGRSESVRALPGYWKIFTSAESYEEFMSDNFPGEEYWPLEPDWDARARLTSHGLFYHDVDGGKFTVLRE